MVAKGKNRRRRGRGAFVAEERQPQARIACVLVGEQTEDDAPPVHERLEERGVRTTLEELTTRSLAQRLHQLIQGGLAQTAVGGCRLIRRRELAEARVQLEVAEVSDGDDYVAGRSSVAFWMPGG